MSAPIGHTPGPWSFYDDSDDGKTNRIEIVAVGKTVARIYNSVKDEDVPNARLIAAAPELLEALVKARDAIAGMPHSLAYDLTHLPMIDAAIAKATGAPTSNRADQ